jgi:hypothetical protein
MSKRPGQLYASTPAVPKKKIAGSNPFQGPIVGMDVTRLVPKREPRLTGLAGTHGYGHAPHMKMGALRLSGSKKAHRIGKK